MATIKEWKEDIQNIDGQELEEIHRAFRVLKNWPMFAKEFTGQGLSILDEMIKDEKVLRFAKCSNILMKA